MYNAEQIGMLITELRMEKGLKQKQLSAMLNMSPGNLSNYEHGVYWPALDTLCKLADLFDVSTDFLLGRTDYRCPPEVFRKYTAPDHTMRHIINTLRDLDTASLDAIVKYVDYLKGSGPAATAKSAKQFSRKTGAPRRSTDQERSFRP